jgi:hypothetical protein
MAGYIYLPIYTTETMSWALDWQAGQSAKGKIPYQVLFNPNEKGVAKRSFRKETGGCLRLVNPDDKVYIVTHGAGIPDSRFIGAERSSDYKKYTPEGIASTLQKEGLTKLISRVKVFACGSAIPGQMPPFAQRLKAAMVKNGYLSVMVTGYLGDVKPSYAPRSIDIFNLTEEEHKGAYDEDDAMIVRASTKRVVF